jgi:hypothetical protein
MRKHLPRIVVFALVTAAACSKSETKSASEKPAEPTPTAANEPAPSTPPMPAFDASQGSCEVTVEGDVQATAKTGGGGAAVGTDYWYTPEGLDSAIERMVQMIESDKSKWTAAIADAKKNDPKITVLVINCLSDRIKLSFMPNKAKYADVPFGPGKYRLNEREPKPNGFWSPLSIDGTSYQLPSGVTGTLEITRFDASGIAGTFERPGEAVDRDTKAVKKVTVKGKFDFTCPNEKSAACTTGR